MKCDSELYFEHYLERYYEMFGEYFPRMMTRGMRYEDQIKIIKKCLKKGEPYDPPIAPDIKY